MKCYFVYNLKQFRATYKYTNNDAFLDAKLNTNKFETINECNLF